MTPIGRQTYVNGSISNTGPAFSVPGGYPWAMLDDTRNVVLVHPANTSGAVYQFCPAQSGTYRAQGEFARGTDAVNEGTGVQTVIFVNRNLANPLAQGGLGPSIYVDANNYYPSHSTFPFDVSATLTGGTDCLRFGVFANAPNNGFDATAVRLQITGTVN
jgi:hypothetical protein